MDLMIFLYFKGINTLKSAILLWNVIINTDHLDLCLIR